MRLTIQHDNTTLTNDHVHNTSNSRSTIGVYFYFRFDSDDSEANAVGSVSRLAGIERATGDSPRRSKPIYNTYRGAASPETSPPKTEPYPLNNRAKFHSHTRCRRGKNVASPRRKAKGANCVRFLRL